MKGNRSEETGVRRGRDIGESVGSSDGWMDIERDQNLKSSFDKCRVQKRQNSKAKGIWLKMSKNWVKLLFRREDSNYELQQ